MMEMISKKQTENNIEKKCVVPPRRRLGRQHKTQANETKPPRINEVSLRAWGKNKQAEAEQTKQRDNL